MSVPDSMLTFAGRLASFAAAQLPKRRASNAKNQKTISWPHTSPSPEDLARAGFFYRPTASSADNVACFLCRKSLDGWEEEDSPVSEHLHHSPTCGWAVNAGIAQRKEDEHPVEEDPLSDELMEARKATFMDLWPHEGKRGWTCKMQKMVEAGWYYCPTPESDDFVSCAYCSLSLDGWEPKDNPLREHQRRSPDCAFFLLTSSASTKTSATATASKPTRTKKGRASKASRLSTQSTISIASEAPSNADISCGADDSIMTTGTVNTTASVPAKSKARKPTKSNKKTAVAKAPRTRTVKKDVVPDEDSVTASSEKATPKRSASPPPKETRGKKRSNAVMEESKYPDSHEEKQAIAEPAPKRRATRTRSSMAQLQSAPATVAHEEESHDLSMTDAQVATASETSTKTKGGRTSRKRPTSTRPAARVVSAASTASKASLRAELPDDEQIDAALNADLDRPLTDEEAGEEIEERPTKSRRLTRTRQVKAAASVAPVRKISRTTKKTVNKERLFSSSPELPVALPSSQASVVPAKEATPTPSPAPVKEATPTPSPQAPYKEVTPSPAPRGTAKEVLPSPSPQSSDAENQPPSSHPISSPSKHQPLSFPVTSTPIVSPSKRNIISGGLQTSFPWKSVDLENIFITSPSSRPWDVNKEDVGVDGTVSKAIELLTSPEKKMSVEEWIRHNSSVGEEIMRRECERMANKFEQEGVRALRALEGIQCVE
ncbi:MAG: hypothetical protein M1819_005346 [Sarea resinae]|nr:MAG: hypothetical protein M1819_005346 [Sarea resinae]